MQRLTWDDVGEHVAIMAATLRNHEFRHVWGVPRGGAIVAGMLAIHGMKPVDEIEKADVIIDDIWDSGATARRFFESHPGKPFMAMITKSDPSQWIMFPWEVEDHEETGEETARRFLQSLEVDLSPTGRRDTPARFARALRSLLAGEQEEVGALLETKFKETYDEVVMVRDLPFVSVCEHHVMPFIGKATIGYLPAGKVIGLSKIPRALRALSRRMQIQERLTQEIAKAIWEAARPRGVGVILRATHTCMTLRGIESSGEMVTSFLLGTFREGPPRAEFFSLAARP